MRYFEGHTGFVQTVAFSPDGRHLASGGADGVVRLWDVVTGGEAARVAPSEGEWVGALAFSPDGRCLAIGTHDGGVHLYDVAGREMGERGPWEGQGRVTALGFAPDGDRLAWGSYSGGAWLFLPSHAAPSPFRDGGHALTFALGVAPDGRTFATGGTGPEVVIRRLPTGAEVRRLAHGDRQGCWSMAYAPGGKTLALALGGGVQLWDAAKGRLRGERADHRDLVSACAYSPEGGRLLTAGWDGEARLYATDPANGAVLREAGVYDWKIGRLFDVAISPDGTLAAAGGNEPPYLVVWDVE